MSADLGLPLTVPPSPLWIQALLNTPLGLCLALSGCLGALGVLRFWTWKLTRLTILNHYRNKYLFEALWESRRVSVRTKETITSKVWEGLESLGNRVLGA